MYCTSLRAQVENFLQRVKGTFHRDGSGWKKWFRLQDLYQRERRADFLRNLPCELPFKVTVPPRKVIGNWGPNLPMAHTAPAAAFVLLNDKDWQRRWRNLEFTPNGAVNFWIFIFYLSLGRGAINDFAKNLRASPLNGGLSINTTFSWIHLDEQLVTLRKKCKHFDHGRCSNYSMETLVWLLGARLEHCSVYFFSQHATTVFFHQA